MATVDDLLAAIEAAPTDGTQVTIALQGDADGVFDLGTHGKIAISGQRNIVIKDAGASVSLARTNSGDGAAPLFYVKEGSTLTISSGAADDGTPLFSYSGQEAPLARTYQGSTLVIGGGLFDGNRSSYGALVQNGYENSTTDWSWGRHPVDHRRRVFQQCLDRSVRRWRGVFQYRRLRVADDFRWYVYG